MHLMFPKQLIDKSVKGYLKLAQNNRKGHFLIQLNVKHPTATSIVTLYRLSFFLHINKYCKDLNVKIIFSPFKLSTMFSPKDFVLDSPKSCVVYQFHVRAVKLVILLKPIGVLTHVLISVSFGTKIPTFLNISVLLKVVGISLMFLLLRFLIMPALILDLK